MNELRIWITDKEGVIIASVQARVGLRMEHNRYISRMTDKTIWTKPLKLTGDYYKDMEHMHRNCDGQFPATKKYLLSKSDVVIPYDWYEQRKSLRVTKSN